MKKAAFLFSGAAAAMILVSSVSQAFVAETVDVHAEDGVLKSGYPLNMKALSDGTILVSSDFYGSKSALIKEFNPISGWAVSLQIKSANEAFLARGKGDSVWALIQRVYQEQTYIDIYKRENFNQWTLTKTFDPSMTGRARSFSLTSNGLLFIVEKQLETGKKVTLFASPDGVDWTEIKPVLDQKANFQPTSISCEETKCFMPLLSEGKVTLVRANSDNMTDWSTHSNLDATTLPSVFYQDGLLTAFFRDVDMQNIITTTFSVSTDVGINWSPIFVYPKMENAVGSFILGRPTYDSNSKKLVVTGADSVPTAQGTVTVWTTRLSTDLGKTWQLIDSFAGEALAHSDGPAVEFDLNGDIYIAGHAQNASGVTPIIVRKVSN